VKLQCNAEMPDLYVIKGGINAEEQILLEGIRKVKDGDKIEFDYVDPQFVISHLKVYVE
jgi:membrane fusion protein (multidrug efflux system)